MNGAAGRAPRAWVFISSWKGTPPPAIRTARATACASSDRSTPRVDRHSNGRDENGGGAGDSANPLSQPRADGSARFRSRPRGHGTSPWVRRGNAVSWPTLEGAACRSAANLTPSSAGWACAARPAAPGPCPWISHVMRPRPDGRRHHGSTHDPALRPRPSPFPGASSTAGRAETPGLRLDPAATRNHEESAMAESAKRREHTARGAPGQ